MALELAVKKYVKTTTVVVVDLETGNIITGEVYELTPLYAGNVRVVEVHKHDNFTVLVITGIY